MLGAGRSNSWDLLDYIFVNGNASILTWGVGVTAQGENLTLDMGEGWAGPRTLLEVFKGKLGAAALSAGVRSSPDEKISEVSYSLEVLGLQGFEAQRDRTTDASGLFGDWWVGGGYGVGVGATMMRWFSVPIAVLPED